MARKRPKDGREQPASQTSPEGIFNNGFRILKGSLGMAEITLGSLATLLGIAAGIFASYHYLLCALLMFGAVVIVSILLWHLRYRHGVRKKHIVSPVAWFLGVLAAALVLGAIGVFWSRSPRRPAPFAISIETLWQGEGRDDTQIFCEYNDRFLSPVPILMFLRIVNRQEFPATIATMWVQVQLRKRWYFLPNGWLDTTVVPSYMPLIYVNPPPTGPLNLKLVGRRLDVQLNNQIEPHHTIEGWLLFDVPEEFKDATSPHVYRISLKDTEGHRFTVIDQGPTDKGFVTTIGTERGIETGGPVNISHLQLRHLADPPRN